MASALLEGLAKTGHRGMVLLCDADVRRTLGRIISEDPRLAGPIVALDGLKIGAFDFVDVGHPYVEQGVVPVTVKSLSSPDQRSTRIRGVRARLVLATGAR